MKITKTCPILNKEVTLDIKVTQEQLDQWNKGMLIQDAMPNLSPEEREFIKTGISPEGWNRMLGIQ